ncbi:zinc carboxypeptidase-like [Drosophila kikkawai]|uniref:Zinc carboxypeptidase-like n=1 Tax=Drosophila kikkawai TaxID=30033 RepID=A0A6P4IDK1_DROKI|nr:mast cell carboxypeptidase A-like [Drosophila kikkawai]
MWRPVFLILAVATAHASIQPSELMSNELKLDKYYTYAEMESYLRNLSNAFRDKITLEELAKTDVDHLSVYKVKVSNNQIDGPKKAILLDAAIHGNEWITTTVALKAIYELVTGKNNFLEKSDWYILPMVNPDGYEYTLPKKNDKWMKNRKPNEGGEIGVNLNRNFDFNWDKTKDRSNMSWSENYRGSKPLSEPESLALANLMKELTKSNKEVIYISLHTEHQSSIFYPSVFEGKPTKNNASLAWLAQYASEKIFNETRSKYTHGVPVTYKGTGGTSLDYAYDLGISMAFDLEFGQEKSDDQSLDSFISNRANEGWSGVYHLAEGAFLKIKNGIIEHDCDCNEDEDDAYIAPPGSNSPTDDSDDDNDDCSCKPDKKKASSAGENVPFIGIFSTLLLYVSYTILN